MARQAWPRLLGATLLMAPAVGWSQSPDGLDTALPEVTVRARGAVSAARAAAHHVTVITASDIARSTATSLGDLLSGQGNLSLQSYFGHDKSATIDMRGMGATAGSNVLIVVDGVRLNANDMSGADLSSLALSQVERVEIVRGGGAVREGSGAVGGVIRITTRRSLPEGTTSTHVQARVGAYQSNALDLSSMGHFGPVTAVVQAHRSESAGYRDNSELSARNAALELRWAPTLLGAATDLHIKASTHRDRYGLPGPVSLEAFRGDSRARRHTNTPLAGGTTTVERVDIGATLDWGASGRVEWRASHRDRHNPYLMGVDPARPLSDQQSKIDAGQWDLHASYTLDGEVLGMTHTTSLGWDRLDGDYARWENGVEQQGSSTRLLGQASSNALYIESSLQPTKALTLNAGLRWNQFTTKQLSARYDRTCDWIYIPFPVQVNCSPYAYMNTGPTQAGDWFNRGAELGLNWQISPAWGGFVSASRTFRAPNIDELLLASDTLRPQRGSTRELGIRHQASTTLDWSATWFLMQNQAEIYYGLDTDGSRVNRNHDQATHREGLELEAHWQPVPTVRLQGQWTHLSARFQGIGGDIPLVARTSASAQLEWLPVDSQRWTLSMRHVGKRLDGNATNDEPFEPLAAYTVWNMAWRYTRGPAEWTLGVNNLFNKIYSTQAYSQTYYPMPERHLYLALGWRL